MQIKIHRTLWEALSTRSKVVVAMADGSARVVAMVAVSTCSETLGATKRCTEMLAVCHSLLAQAVATDC